MMLFAKICFTQVSSSAVLKQQRARVGVNAFPDVYNCRPSLWGCFAKVDSSASVCAPMQEIIVPHVQCLQRCVLWQCLDLRLALLCQETRLVTICCKLCAVLWMHLVSPTTIWDVLQWMEAYSVVLVAFNCVAVVVFFLSLYGSLSCAFLYLEALYMSLSLE